MKKLVKIKNIASYSKGSQINGDELMENAEYDYLNGGIKPSGRWNETNCEANTVTISEGGNSCGYVNYMSKPFWCGAHCYYFFETVKNTRYLYYALKSQQNRIMKLRSGACMPNIKKVDLGNFEFIFDDDESEQDKVTSILSGIEKIITISKREVQLLDDLVNARFVELFGNPIKNEKQWEILKLGDCLKRIDNGKSFTCDVQARKGEHPAILKLSAVTYGVYRPGENKALLDEKLFVDSAEVHSGDLLFTRKNTPELVGMAAYVYDTPDHLMMPDLIFRLVPNERMTAIFLWQLINNREFRPVIQSIAGGSAKSMSNISKERLSNISVICPPMDEQIRLNEIIYQVAKSKLILKKHHFERGILSGDKFFIS